MDGVLFDSATFAYREMCRIYPGMTEAMMKEINCGNFHEAIEKLTIPKIVETEEEAEARRTRYANEKSNAPLFDGVFNLLKDLHAKGYLLVLNTSASNRNCTPLLDRAGILEVFDFIGTKEVSKSKVEKFGIIKEKYNVALEEMVFITDTLGDLREAEIALVPTIAVTYGAHEREYFTRETYTSLVTIVDSVDELRSALEQG